MNFQISCMPFKWQQYFDPEFQINLLKNLYFFEFSKNIFIIPKLLYMIFWQYQLFKLYFLNHSNLELNTFSCFFQTLSFK